MPATTKGVARLHYIAPQDTTDTDTRWCRCVDLAMDALSHPGRSRLRVVRILASSAAQFDADGHPAFAERARRLMARLETK